MFIRREISRKRVADFNCITYSSSERLLRQSDSEEDAVDGDDGSDDGTDEDEYDTDDD